MGDLWLDGSGWLAEEQLQGNRRTTRLSSLGTLERLFGALRSSRGCTTDMELQELASWGWPITGACGSNWNLKMSQWRQLFSEGVGNLNQFNRRWGLNYTDNEWTKFWKKIWSGWGIPRAKFICWRVL